MKARVKQLFFIIGVALIVLIITTIITGEINFNNFIIFLSGGTLGLVLGREETKKETKKEL